MNLCCFNLVIVKSVIPFTRHAKKTKLGCGARKQTGGCPRAAAGLEIGGKRAPRRLLGVTDVFEIVIAVVVAHTRLCPDSWNHALRVGASDGM